MPELDTEHREQLVAVFRGSTRNPEHLAFLAEPLVAGWIADARANALRNAADALGYAHAPVAGYLRELADSYRGGDDG